MVEDISCKNCKSLSVSEYLSPCCSCSGYSNWEPVPMRSQEEVENQLEAVESLMTGNKSSCCTSLAVTKQVLMWVLNKEAEDQNE